jgi:hypothetical protein
LGNEKRNVLFCDNLIVTQKYLDGCHPERSASRNSYSSMLSSAKPKDPDAAYVTMPLRGILTKTYWVELPDAASLLLTFSRFFDSPSLLRRSLSLRMTGAEFIFPSSVFSSLS